MKKPKIIQLIEDIGYATMGVQTSEEHKKDFEHTSMFTYLVASLIAIALFGAVIALIVSLLL